MIFVDTDTEASHLAELYDESDFMEPYSDIEKRQYIRKKALRFPKSVKGKYVIAQKPRRNKHLIDWLYLTDRNKTKQWWWTTGALFAKIFDSAGAAQRQACKYKYNFIKIIKL